MPEKRVEFNFGGLFNSVDQAKIDSDKCYSMQNASVDRKVLGAREGYSHYAQCDGASGSDIGYGDYYCSYALNTKWRLRSTGSANGHIRLTVIAPFGSETTADILINPLTPADLKAALVALALLEDNDVDVTGTQGDWTIEFVGTVAETLIDMQINTSGLTSGSATLTRLQAGGEYKELLFVVDKGGLGGKNATLWRKNIVTGVVEGPLNTDPMVSEKWLFQQYGKYVYMVARHSQIFQYLIGGTASDTSVGPPPPGEFQNNRHVTRLTAPMFPGFTFGWTVQNLTGFAAGSGTIAFVDDHTIRITKDGTVSTWGPISFDLIPPNDNPNHELNMAFCDTILLATIRNSVDTAVLAFPAITTEDIKLYHDSGTPVTCAQPFLYGYSEASSYAEWDAGYQFLGDQSGQIGRAARKAINKITIKLNCNGAVPNGTCDIRITFQRAWAMDTQDLVPIQSVHPPYPNYNSTSESTAKPKYALTFYNSTSGKESVLGPIELPFSQPPAYIGPQGLHYKIPIGSVVFPPPAIADKIRVYRIDAQGKWRRLPNTTSYPVNVYEFDMIANEIMNDVWMEDEITAFPEYGADGGGGGTFSKLARSAEVIGTWRGSLVLGARRKIYMSYVQTGDTGIPRFIDTYIYPDAEPANVTSLIGRGRTFYLSSDRSANPFGAYGLDSLYIPSDKEQYAVTGNLPADASPPRHLPGTRGAVSTRGNRSYGGGLECLANDGIYFYGVGRGFQGQDDGSMIQREETVNVRKSVENLLAGTTGEDAVMATYGSDEVWVWNGPKYIHFSRNKLWEEGTFADTVVDACSVFGQGIYFQARNGQIMLLGQGATSDNGAAIAWRYETGTEFAPRRRAIDVEWYGGGSPIMEVHTTDGQSTETYDAVNVKPFTLDTSRKSVTTFQVLPGVKYKYVFKGNSSADYITSLAVKYEESGPADAG